MRVNTKEASKIIGITPNHLNMKFKNPVHGVTRHDMGRTVEYDLDELLAYKAREDSKPECRNCGNKFVNTLNDSYGFCRSSGCNLARTRWLKNNWDQMPENNKFKRRYESEFWEVTPEQKEKFATFFSLIKVNESKKRPCLRCRKAFESFSGNRICSECHEITRKIGALAEC